MTYTYVLGIYVSKLHDLGREYKVELKTKLLTPSFQKLVFRLFIDASPLRYSSEHLQSTQMVELIRQEEGTCLSEASLLSLG